MLKLCPELLGMPASTAQQPMKCTAGQLTLNVYAKTKMATIAGTVLVSVLFGTLSAILPPHYQPSMLTMTHLPEPMAKVGF